MTSVEAADHPATPERGEQSTDISTLVLVPCFSGNEWDVDAFAPWAGLTLVAPRLPEGLSDVLEYADFIADVVKDLPDHVMVGDSFGAVVALGHALRQPERLRGLVLSGGFASDPIHRFVPRLGSHLVAFQRGPIYRHITLRVHARLLASRFDFGPEAEAPWTPRDTLELFRSSTPPESYVARVAAARAVDFLGQLDRVTVPTLVVTPAEDGLIDPAASEAMVKGLPDVEEVVLPRTGHMFRFAHPTSYAQAVTDFMVRRDLTAVGQRSG